MGIFISKEDVSKITDVTEAALLKAYENQDWKSVVKIHKLSIEMVLRIFIWTFYATISIPVLLILGTFIGIKIFPWLEGLGQNWHIAIYTSIAAVLYPFVWRASLKFIKK